MALALKFLFLYLLIFMKFCSFNLSLESNFKIYHFWLLVPGPESQGVNEVSASLSHFQRPFIIKNEEGLSLSLFIPTFSLHWDKALHSRKPTGHQIWWKQIDPAFRFSPNPIKHEVVVNNIIIWGQLCTNLKLMLGWLWFQI